RRRCASSWPRWPASVKIVRRHTRQAMAQRPDQLGAHRGDVVLTLQRSLDQQEGLLDERQPVTVEERGTHDDVDQSRLVLEIEEHEALGGAGTLAHHYRPRHLHPRSVTEGGQVTHPRHPHTAEPT